MYCRPKFLALTAKRHLDSVLYATMLPLHTHCMDASFCRFCGCMCNIQILVHTWMHTEEPRGKWVNTCQLEYESFRQFIYLGTRVARALAVMVCIHSLVSIFIMQPRILYHKASYINSSSRPDIVRMTFALTMYWRRYFMHSWVLLTYKQIYT